jgi:hypothetical protein
MKTCERLWVFILGLWLIASGVLIFMVGIRQPLYIDNLIGVTYGDYSYWFVATAINRGDNRLVGPLDSSLSFVGA